MAFFIYFVVSCLLVLQNANCGPCDSAPFNTYPYCNPELSVDVRVQDLLGRLTLDEKISQTMADNYPVPRLNIPPFGNYFFLRHFSSFYF